MSDTLNYDDIKRVLESLPIPAKRVFFFPMEKMAELVYAHRNDPAYRISRKKITLAHIDIYFSPYLTGDDGYEVPPNLILTPKIFLTSLFWFDNVHTIRRCPMIKG